MKLVLCCHFLSLREFKHPKGGKGKPSRGEAEAITDGQKEFESGDAHAPAAPVEAVTVAVNTSFVFLSVKAIPEPEAPKEDEPVQFTLEEFLRQKESKKSASLPKQRKAGEGEDAKWPAGQELVKDDEEKVETKV